VGAAMNRPRSSRSRAMALAMRERLFPSSPRSTAGRHALAVLHRMARARLQDGEDGARVRAHAANAPRQVVDTERLVRNQEPVSVRFQTHTYTLP